MSRPPVVVLGPTASGKSDVAMAAAGAAGNCHIVACDAMQVYRGMDIGTAKPTPADRAAITHHGLDLCEPSERYTVARFAVDIEAARAVISAAGARELIVGGTGLYLTAIIDGLTMPGEWPEIRAALEADEDTAAMHERLRGLDPVAADRIEPANRRRIVRALEVCIGSGAPFSSFGDGVAAHPDNGAVLVGIRWQRDALRERIARRVRLMVGAGARRRGPRPGLGPGRSLRDRGPGARLQGDHRPPGGTHITRGGRAGGHPAHPAVRRAPGAVVPPRPAHHLGGCGR